jgi:hypothetical protein
MKVNLALNRPVVLYGLSTTLGVLYVFVLYGLYGPTDDPPFTAISVASFFVMVVPGFILGRRVKPLWSVGILVCAGICAGVVANAAYDLEVHHLDHNLFQVEIVVLSAFAMPGVVTGLGLAWLALRFNKAH